MRSAPDHQVLSVENMVRLLGHLALTGNVTLSCAAVGISTQQAQQWRNRSKRDRKDPRYLITDVFGDDPDIAFCDAWDRALADALDLVRDNVFEMAAGLKRKQVIHQGKPAYLPDTQAEYRFDPLSGLPVYPPKTDPLSGEPLPLLEQLLFPNLSLDVLKVRDPDYRPKTDVDITTAGKPLMVGDRSGMTAEKFMERFGRKLVDDK